MTKADQNQLIAEVPKGSGNGPMKVTASTWAGSESSGTQDGTGTQA